jgi:hypothetical protein
MPTLNDRELKVLSEAATLVPLAMRDSFVRHVANRFHVCGDLIEAIRIVLGAYGIAVGRAVLKQGRRA